jgi:hypothetical protein
MTRGRGAGRHPAAAHRVALLEGRAIERRAKLRDKATAPEGELVRSPQWARLRSEILAALTAHPAALRAVLAVLEATVIRSRRRQGDADPSGAHSRSCVHARYHVPRRLAPRAARARRAPRRDRLREAVYHWARVATQHDEKSRVLALRARGKTHGRALRTIGDRPLALACAMLREQLQSARRGLKSEVPAPATSKSSTNVSTNGGESMTLAIRWTHEGLRRGWPHELGDWHTRSARLRLSRAVCHAQTCLPPERG